MDKNTIIGFVLIAAILIGWSWYTRPSEEELKAKMDSGEIKQMSYAEFSHSAYIKTIETQEMVKEQEQTETSPVIYWMYSPGENACFWDMCKEEGVISPPLFWALSPIALLAEHLAAMS